MSDSYSMEAGHYILRVIAPDTRWRWEIEDTRIGHVVARGSGDTEEAAALAAGALLAVCQSHDKEA